MAEGTDSIDYFIDRNGIRSDKEFGVEAIRAVYSELLKLDAIKVDLKNSLGLAQIAPTTQQAKAGIDSLALATERAAKTIAEHNGHSKEFTTVLLNQAKAEKEAATTGLLNAKARKENAQAALLEERAIKSKTDALDKETAATKKRNDEASKLKSRPVESIPFTINDPRGDKTDGGQIKNLNEQRTAVSNLDIAQAKAANSGTAMAVSTTNNVSASKLATQAISSQSAAQVAAVDSINGLRATLKEATKEYENLSAAQRMSPKGQALQNLVIGLTKEVSIQEQSIGKFQRNVGNYASGVGKFASKAFGYLRTLANLIPGLGIGSLLLVIGDQIAGIFTNTNKLASSTKILSNAQKEANSTTREQVVTMQSLLAVGRNVNNSYKERQGAIDELNKQFPEFNNQLSLENINSEKSAALIERVTQNLIKQAKAKVLITEISKLSLALDEAERIKKETGGLISEKVQKSIDQYTERIKTLTAAVNDFTKAGLGSALDPEKAAKEGIKKTNELIEDTNDKIKKIQEKNRKKSESDAEKAKSEAERRSREAKQLADAALQTEFDIQSLKLKQTIDFNKQAADDDTKSLQVRLESLRFYNEASKTLIELNAELQKKLGNKTALELIKVDEEKYDALLRLANTFTLEVAKVNQDYTKKFFENTKSQEKELRDSLSKIAESGAKAFFDAQDARLKKQKDTADKLISEEKRIKEETKKLYQDLYKEIADTAAAFFTAQDDRKIAGLQSEIDAIEARKQKEIETINQTVANRTDAAAQIAIVEARTQAQREILEKKQRDIEKKKQSTERLAQIATIAGTTAQGVVSLSTKAAEIKATAALLAANPLTAAYAPVALANAVATLAQIPIVIGIGAAQIARLAIPKYKDGKNVGDAYEGPAIVGDGGKKEAIIREDGSIEITSDKPQLTHVKKRDIVLPDANMLVNYVMAGHMGGALKGQSRVKENNGVELAVKTMEKNIVSAIQNKKELHLSAGEAGMTALWKHAANTTRYINEQTQWNQ